MRSGLLLLCVCVAGCAQVQAPLDALFKRSETPAQPVGEPLSAIPADVASPVAATGQPPDALDTTTDTERAAAERQTGQGRALGTTVAALGDPARPGFWIETPLVSIETKGRVSYAGAGTTANVTLLPLDAPQTAGSRLSLAAMRVLEAPLTDLVEVEVFAEG